MLPSAQGQGAPRVTGGTEVLPGEYPYLASVLFARSGGLGLACGGTLIAPSWVLSARHCFDDLQHAVYVGLGSPNLDTPLQTIAVAEIVRHPAGPGSDLALLHLAEEADVSQPTIGVATYATRLTLPSAGSRATVAGWGDTDPAADIVLLPSIAQKADIILEPCNGNIGNAIGLPDTQQANVCGWNTLARDACFGDSGGPLVGFIDGVETVVATVESGAIDGTCGLVSYGVYHRIAPHHGWIQQTIASHSAETCAGLPVTIDMSLNGGNGMGTAGDDVIVGTKGDDLILAAQGNDIVCAGLGHDRVVGGSGDDNVFGGNGDDLLIGGDGDDILRGQSDHDTIRGDGGADTLLAGTGDDWLRGGTGNDTLRGSLGNDTMRGGDGDDVMRGNEGFDLLNGGSGADKLIGGADDDEMNGGFGHDSCEIDVVTDITQGCELQ